MSRRERPSSKRSKDTLQTARIYPIQERLPEYEQQEPDFILGDSDLQKVNDWHLRRPVGTPWSYRDKRTGLINDKFPQKVEAEYFNKRLQFGFGVLDA